MTSSSIHLEQSSRRAPFTLSRPHPEQLARRAASTSIRLSYLCCHGLPLVAQKLQVCTLRGFVYEHWQHWTTGKDLPKRNDDDKARY